jgi:hypothetical protein
MSEMTPVAKKVVEYAEKQMQRAADDIIACEAKKKESFTYWVQWNFSRMVANEMALFYWTAVRNNIMGGKMSGGVMSDQHIKAYLINFRNDVIKEILQSTNKNSTNQIAVEIEIIQEDVRKKFAGMSCIDTGSLSEILYDTFGENVRIQDAE